MKKALVVAVMLLIWAGVNIWLDSRRRKNEAVLVAGVADALDERRATRSATVGTPSIALTACASGKAWPTRGYGRSPC